MDNIATRWEGYIGLRFHGGDSDDDEEVLNNAEAGPCILKVENRRIP